MPKYRLRVPAPGTYLYDDGPGSPSVVASTIDEARDYLAEYTDDEQPPIYLHSYIGRCEVLYKSQIDNGEGHEGAEPGDTTVWYTPDDGRDLAEHECRVWQLGRPDFRWDYAYSEPEPVDWRTIPIGTTVHHPTLGSGRTVSVPRHGLHKRTAVVDCRFAWPTFTGPIRTLQVATTSFMPSQEWPGERRRITLTVAGEVVAENLTDKAARDLLDLRVMRLTAEWEADQFALYHQQLLREAVAT